MARINWIYKTILNEDRSYLQQHDNNVIKKFAPVVRMGTVVMLLLLPLNLNSSYFNRLLNMLFSIAKSKKRYISNNLKGMKLQTWNIKFTSFGKSYIAWTKPHVNGTWLTSISVHMGSKEVKWFICSCEIFVSMSITLSIRAQTCKLFKNLCKAWKGNSTCIISDWWNTS